MEKLFSNQYLTVFLPRISHQTLALQWLDFVPSADFRRVIEEVTRLAQQH